MSPEPAVEPTKLPWERSTLGILFVFLFAMGLGTTAGLLQGFQTLPTPSASHPSLPYGEAGWVLGLLVFCLVGIFLVYRIFRRKTGYNYPINSGAVILGFVVVVVIVIAILGLVTSVHPPPNVPVGTTTGHGGGPGTNSTGAGGGGGGSTNGTNLNATHAATPSIPTPVYGLTAGIIVALVAVPFAAYLLARGRQPLQWEGPPRDLVRSLAAAEKALTDSPPQEARDRIVQAYGVLLQGLRAKGLTQQEASTAQEIERSMVEMLGLTSPSAEGLRSLFEEARYSSHPMTEQHRREAGELLATVLEELRERRPVGARAPRTLN